MPLHTASSELINRTAGVASTAGLAPLISSALQILDDGEWGGGDRIRGGGDVVCEVKGTTGLSVGCASSAGFPSSAGVASSAGFPSSAAGFPSSAGCAGGLTHLVCWPCARTRVTINCQRPPRTALSCTHLRPRPFQLGQRQHVINGFPLSASSLARCQRLARCRRQARCRHLARCRHFLARFLLLTSAPAPLLLPLPFALFEIAHCQESSLSPLLAFCQPARFKKKACQLARCRRLARCQLDRCRHCLVRCQLVWLAVGIVWLAVGFGLAAVTPVWLVLAVGFGVAVGPVWRAVGHAEVARYAMLRGRHLAVHIPWLDHEEVE